MRDYTGIERYLNELQGDVYDQPPDVGHQAAIEDVIARWVSGLQGLQSVLDVGCGQGQAFEALSQHTKRVTGVTLGNDAEICRDKGLDVFNCDMSFLPFEDSEFDLIFARHTLEHSPMPLLTLMEWHRVARQWLLLIVPRLSAFGPSGRNHYYVLHPDQWANLLDRAGWHVFWEDESNDMEHRWMCEKKRRILRG